MSSAWLEEGILLQPSAGRGGSRVLSVGGGVQSRTSAPMMESRSLKLLSARSCFCTSDTFCRRTAKAVSVL
jgi:hypothetical protein